MRLKRLFKRTEPADPFAAFAQTYGIRIPHDSPPPKAEPAEPQPHDTSPPKAEPAESQPVEPDPTRTQQVPRTYGIGIPHDSPPPKVEPAEPQPHDTSPPKAEPAESQPVEPQPVEPQPVEPQPHDSPPPKTEPVESQPVEPGPMRAHQVLGVPLGALGHEVSQAHRKLALMHHPDKMASMGPEAEEYSEERMKEINAAYDELRRRGA